MALSPEQKSLRSRAAAHVLHGTHDSRELTKAARSGFAAKFERLADPEGLLPEAERKRRADHLLKSHMASLSLKASKARRKKTSSATTAASEPAADATTTNPERKHRHATNQP
jgi:hypothetical protein